MIDRRMLNDDAACMANALKAIWSHYEEESLKECLNKDKKFVYIDTCMIDSHAIYDYYISTGGIESNFLVAIHDCIGIVLERIAFLPELPEPEFLATEFESDIRDPLGNPFVVFKLTEKERAGRIFLYESL